jgi:PEP-CTERM motif
VIQPEVTQPDDNPENGHNGGTNSGAVRPEDVRIEMRRRPTRRHRRNRVVRRICLVAVLGFFTLGFSAVALHYLSPSLFDRSHAATPLPKHTQEDIAAILRANQVQPAPRAERPEYPYSIIPGGVADARELKWVAEHDPVVAAHYAGFDYNHARVVRLVLAQTVYVSYRVGKNVYWTRHRITLKKGETVLTDGKITARTKCGNRVEDVPQQATSSSEPPAAKFEEPVGRGDGTAMQSPPVPFQSALMSRPGVAGFEPGPPTSIYNPFPGGTWTPLAPPPIPVGVCGPVKKKGTGTTATVASPAADFEVSGDQKKKKVNPCSNTGTAPVPEPGTWLMIATGLALIGLQARRKFARA